MFGAITNRDILAHPIVTVRSFGWRIFFKAIFSGREKTFLSLLQGAHLFDESASMSGSPELLGRSIELELQANRIYEVFAKTFASSTAVRHFFKTLAQQERDHADMLELCRAAAIRGRWKLSYLNPWQGYLPHLEQMMQEIENSMYSIQSVNDALSLVIHVESSELNPVFEAVVASSDSVFIQKMIKFRTVMKNHISYIAETLPQLSPQFMRDSRELRSKFLREA